MAKTEALVPAEKPGALARPSFVPESDHRGTDHITKDDLVLPRLSLVQLTSPQLVPGDPKHIPDLKFGEAFNTVTGANYGKGPFEIVLIRADRPRGIEFAPLEEGGGIVDFNVPLDDPRMQFTTNADGDRVKPVATKFYDYVAILVGSGEMIALSLKGSGIKTAKQLNALIKLSGGPLFAQRYNLAISTERNAKGTFAVFKVAPLGWVQDEASFKRYEKLFEEIKDRTLAADVEPVEEDE